MINPRFEQLAAYPFSRLAALLAQETPPAGVEPLLLSLGEPRLGPPEALAAILSQSAADWGRYPPAQGTPGFRRTVAGWATHRFGLPDALITPDRHIAPCCGTREALFLLGHVAVPPEKAGQRPVVLLPNPFYHVYEAASVFTGAEAVYLDARPETGFLPDLDALHPEILERTALFFLCSPSNPQGHTASRDYLIRALALARRHDFLLAVDECYSEIYTAEAPSGGLEAAAALEPSRDDPLHHLVILQSLSKRSSVPGLRSGFIAGDAGMIAAYCRLIGQGGNPTPLPILAASEWLWQDEAHVEIGRQRYRANFDAALQRFGTRGYRVPAGGFFLWLDVGDGEAVARRLWREAAIKVMPGAYMARGGEDNNPGRAFIRVALVDDRAVLEPALDRIAALLP